MRAPRDGVCVAMAPVTQRGGLLRCWLSSSTVRRDPVGGGAASRRLPGGRVLGPWGVAVHAEEETVVQLVKRVRMSPSTAALVGVVFLVGGVGGDVSRSIDSGGNLRSRGCHHRRRRPWVSYFSLEALWGLPGSDDGDVCVVTPMGASSLETYVGWKDVWMALVAGRRSPRASRVGTKVERRGIYHSLTASLGGMVQRGLGDGCGMMDARRAVAPSGVVVASTAGRARSMR